MQGSMDSIFFLLIVFMSVIVHEITHGYVAYFLGDPTAKYENRLTLNPLRHVDPIGSILLPALLMLVKAPIFGWAKPVPYNPYNIKAVNQKLGGGLIAISGALSNFFIAGVFSLILRNQEYFSFLINPSFVEIAQVIVFINISLGVFNLVPIPPLDGSKVLFALLPRSLYGIEQTMEKFGFAILIVFILFFSGWIIPIISYVGRLFLGASFSF